MNPERTERTFLKALGPGLLWAGAAIGVSHLVQSTRAGANFGFALIGVVLLANFLKYPAFSFGPRYAAATGTSLLEGYRRRGKWALVLYALLTVGTMFTIQGAVTLVTGALAANLVGWKAPLLGVASVFWVSLVLMGLCAGILAAGSYRWLDKIVKVVVLVLTLSTFTATLLVLPKIPWGQMRWWPEPGVWTLHMGFLAALIGWMPSAFDISIWHSLWTLARRRETKHAPSLRESLLDFNIGYLGTAILALCFLTLGAGVLFTSGRQFPDGAAAFAAQIIALYTENLGAWSEPLITLAALTVMFSTTLTVVDGFPRAIACLLARFTGEERPDEPESDRTTPYWLALAGLFAGAAVVILIGVQGAKGSLKPLVTVATTISFLTSPALAWLNHRAITGHEVPPEHRPGSKLRAWSWAGIAFSAVFAAVYLYWLVA